MAKKNIFITGTSSGFGHEMALQYARKGYQVIATMRIEQASEALLNEKNIDIMIMDLNDSNSIKQAVKTAIQKYGTIDALVNNAGYGEIGALEEVSLSDLKKQFQTNLFGPFELIQALLPAMRQNGGGHILNVSSMGAYIPISTMGAYTASKAALTNMTNVLAQELKKFDIKVTLVEPGGFMTDFFVNQHFAEKIPEYTSVYEETAEYSRKAIEEIGLGNLEKSVELIVETTFKENPPKHLAVGMQGYTDALSNLENLMNQFKENVEQTKLTD